LPGKILATRLRRVGGCESIGAREALIATTLALRSKSGR
jgi:hypothetical protein